MEGKRKNNFTDKKAYQKAEQHPAKLGKELRECQHGADHTGTDESRIYEGAEDYFRVNIQIIPDSGRKKQPKRDDNQIVAQKTHPGVAGLCSNPDACEAANKVAHEEDDRIDIKENIPHRRAHEDIHENGREEHETHKRKAAPPSKP